MIRLEVFQETAHYRIPTIGNPYLSYPLIPPSTVFGFLREITNKESINHTNTKLSIQAKYNGISMEKEQLILETKSRLKTNIINIQKLHQVSTIIHVKSADRFEEKIIKGIDSYPGALRLGRREDIIIDISVNSDKENADYDVYSYYAYVNFNEELDGSLFNVTLDSEVDENLKITGYKFINLLYLPVGTTKKACVFDGNYCVNFIEAD